MPDPITAAIGSIVGGIGSSVAQSRSADKAADAQTASAEAGIDEQRRQFDKVQELLAPYVSAGNDALSGQLGLLGLGGPEAQQAAIARIEGGPQMAAMQQQGENAILQNASATGGLRGGNTQGALAQFRPQMLNSLIDQQYGRLGGLSAMGQASAAGVGAAGQAMGNNVSQLFAQQGAAQGAASLAQGRAFGNFAGQVSQAGGFIGSQFGQPINATAGAPTFGQQFKGNWGF